MVVSRRYGTPVMLFMMMLMVAFGATGREAVAQEPRRTALVPPVIPTEETHPGRWELFAGGRDAPGELASIDGVGVDSRGVAYIGDPANKRIQKLTPDGAPAGSFPIWPGWVGPVGTIEELVVTGGGEVVVLFASPMAFGGPEPYYLIRYAPDGRPLGQFGRPGSGPAELSRPGGLDAAPDGTIWVADTANHRIVAYGRDGRFLRELGSQGTEPGQFKGPGGVGVAPDGRLYVADTGNNRVQVLTAGGALLEVWDNSGPEPDQIVAPTTIRIGRDGSVFVARARFQTPYRFQKFAPDRTLLAGAWLTINSFAVTPDGSVLVDESYGSDGVRRFNDNLEEYDPLVGARIPPDAPGRLARPTGIAFDAHDNVYVSDAERVGVFVFASDGTPLSLWGTRGFDFGQIRVPSAIAIAPGGTICVADYELDRVYKLSSNWELLDTWGGAGSGPGRLHHPNDLAIDAASNVYVADAGNGRIQKFGPRGELLAIWDGRADRGQQWAGSAVAVDALGRVYTYGRTPAVTRLLPDGTRDWVILGSDRSSFTGLAADAGGNLWIVDSGNGRLWKLGPDLQVLAVWGSGTGSGQATGASSRQAPGVGPDFDRPTSVAVDRLGRVYVADRSAQARVWRFTPEGAP